MTFTCGSLFAGIGGFDLAFERQGFRVAWQVEIDRDASRVLKYHWPDVPLFADVRECGAHNLTPVDIITFGSPCQDLSVAGRREGLKGERSGLFYEAIRICGELRPTFALFENVPGLLSSHAGRDFACVLMAFRKLGARDICWRTLDAQYFGVPQRRRRVFLVADFAGERAGSILLNAEGVSGHPAPRRKAGSGVARGTAASTLQGGGRRGSRLDAEMAASAVVIKGAAIGRKPEAGPQYGETLDDGTCYTLNCTEVHADGVNLRENAAALTSSMMNVDENTASGGYLVPTAGADTVFSTSGQSARRSDQVSLQASDDNGTNHVVLPAIALSNRGQDSGDITETLRSDCNGALPMVAHALTGEGADASEDGTGRGTPLVLSLAENQRGELYLSEQTNALATGGGKPGQGYPAVAFAWQQGDDSKHGKDGRGRSWITRAGDYAAGLSANRHDAVAGPTFGVRRLTPTECERLQGFPDSWTATDTEGRDISDSARYRMLGNSVAVPVVEWIAGRIHDALMAAPAEATG